MAYGFAGNINKLSENILAGNFAQELSLMRIESGGHQLSPVEQKIWQDVGPAVVEILKTSEIPPDTTYGFIEYDIPGHLGRCDLVIIGAGFNGQKNGLVIEIKKWSRIDAVEASGYVRMGGRLYIHPAVQALGYRDKIKCFHEEATYYKWHANVWFPDMNSEDIVLLSEQASTECRLWSFTDSGLRSYLKSLFGVGLTDVYFKKYLESVYRQNSLLALELNKRLPNLTKGISRALGAPPHDLTQEQQLVVQTVGHELKCGRKKLVLVSGEPGSGKTVVGISAMIAELARNDRSKVVLALRNNRLCSVVRSAIDGAGLAVGSALVQYVKGGGPGVGIWYQVKEALENQTPLPLYDLIVIDEAHRIPHKNPRGNQHTLSQLDAILLAGKIVVCLFDEGQILNEDDNGTKELIKSVWYDRFPDSQIVDLFLDEQHRLPIEYHEWLANLLNGKKSQLPANYEFAVVSRPSDIIAYLSQRTNNAECGLLASYTFSNGRGENTLRISEPPIHWLMTPNQYNVFWRDRSFRHQFTHCSSVYGCQGFDLDYAGVFWGRDLIMRSAGDSIVFGLAKSNDITDNIGRAFGRSLVTLARMADTDRDLSNLVMNMLINRYRILLSRGRKGTIICCEDDETAATLKTMMAALKKNSQ